MLVLGLAGSLLVMVSAPMCGSVPLVAVKRTRTSRVAPGAIVMPDPPPLSMAKSPLMPSVTTSGAAPVLRRRRVLVSRTRLPTLASGVCTRLKTIRSSLGQPAMFWYDNVGVAVAGRTLVTTKIRSLLSATLVSWYSSWATM